MRSMRILLATNFGHARLMACQMSTCVDHVSSRKNLIGMGKEELVKEVTEVMQQPSYRADQLWNWMYARGVHEFAQMANLSKSLRDTLTEKYVIDYGNIQSEKKALDGTRKWLVSFGQGANVETVFIPGTDRGTMCLSSQVGCSLSCTFCRTGTQKLLRNLTAGEIVGQFMTGKQAFSDFSSNPQDSPLHRVTNIVLMGQGEPLYNWKNVKKAMQIVMDPDGLAVSRRKITLSTSGIVPLINQVKELGIQLAISLHAPRDELRSQLVPINKHYPLAELMKACHEFVQQSPRQRITFEYVMLKDTNDTDADARQLAHLLRGIPCIVNLIPFNPWPGAPFVCSLHERILAFQQTLDRLSLKATVRWPRGDDILAACGQLKSIQETVQLTT